MSKLYWGQGHLALGLGLALLIVGGVPAVRADGDATAGEPNLRFEPAPISAATRAKTSFAPMLKDAAPGVVNIYTSKTVVTKENPLLNDPFFRRFFGDDAHESRARRIPNSLGSGVIVTRDGYILTNNHVIAGADQIKAAMAGAKKEFIAKVVGGDPKSDIAVLKIESDEPLPCITITDSNTLEVGDTVFAIGNPFNLGQTVTRGIVSALGRGNLRIADYENWIQTDASINKGNSGGALVDADGRLVGINTAIMSRTGANQGIAFAVPINFARYVMGQLIEHGRVVRGYLGVSIRSVPDDKLDFFGLSQRGGALVNAVAKGSAAEGAGLLRGDVIVQLNGEPVADVRHLRFAIAKMPPGAVVKMKLMRDGKALELEAALQELPAPKTAAKDKGPRSILRGVAVGELTPKLREDLNVPEDIGGVVVLKVERKSPAAAEGLKKNDIVIEAGRKPVANADDFEAAGRNATGSAVLLDVWRAGKRSYLAVKDRR